MKSQLRPLIAELTLWLLAALCALMAANLSRAGDWTRSVCRLRAPGAIGTGAIFAEDAAAWYLLTNAHVVGRRGNRVQVEFFNAAGQQHPPLRGEVVWSQFASHRVGFARDAAIVRVGKIAEFAPQILTLDDGSHPPEPGAAIISCGCPQGAPPKLLRATIVAAGPEVFDFRPAGASGRSGSPILSADGRIIGLLTWGSNSEGTAQTAANIRAAFAGQRPGRGGMRTYRTATLDRDPLGLCAAPLARLERSPTQWSPEPVAPPLVPIQWPHRCPNCQRGSTEPGACENCGPGQGIARPGGGGEFAPWEGPGGQIAGPEAPAPAPAAPAVPALTPDALAAQMAALEKRLADQLAAIAGRAGPPGEPGPPGPPGSPGAAGASIATPPSSFSERMAAGRFKPSDLLGAIAAAAAAAAGLPAIVGWAAGKLTGRLAQPAAAAVTSTATSAAEAAAQAAIAAAHARAAAHQRIDFNAAQPIHTTHQINQMVPVETNREGLAYAQACARYAQAYPGAARTLEAVQHLKEQILAGMPTPQFSAN